MAPENPTPYVKAEILVKAVGGAFDGKFLFPIKRAGPNATFEEQIRVEDQNAMNLPDRDSLDEVYVPLGSPWTEGESPTECYGLIVDVDSYNAHIVHTKQFSSEHGEEFPLLPAENDNPIVNTLRVSEVIRSIVKNVNAEPIGNLREVTEKARYGANHREENNSFLAELLLRTMAWDGYCKNSFYYVEPMPNATSEEQKRLKEQNRVNLPRKATPDQIYVPLGPPWTNGERPKESFGLYVDGELYYGFAGSRGENGSKISSSFDFDFPEGADPLTKFLVISECVTTVAKYSQDKIPGLLEMAKKGKTEEKISQSIIEAIGKQPPEYLLSCS